MNDMPKSFESLAASIVGDVKTDLVTRQMLCTDGSIYKVMPAAIVYPHNEADVLQTLSFAHRQHISVHSRGAGSGLCGSAIGSGIVLDFTRYMNRLIRIDTDRKFFECQPGYRFGELQADLKNSELFFPPDPSSGEFATFGGMYATNASGAHSVKYGNVADYILDAGVALPGGRYLNLAELNQIEYEQLPGHLQQMHDLYTANRERIEKGYPSVRYNSAGYNLRGLVQDQQLELRRLFAGSEGTLGVTTRLKFRLIEKPLQDSLVIAFFDDIGTSARAVQQILPFGPAGIEIMDKSLLRFARDGNPELRDKIPGDIDNVLLIEFDGATAAALAQEIRQLLRTERFTAKAYIAVSPQEKEEFWALRKAAVPTLYKLKGRKRILALIEDAAVPTARLVEYVDGIYHMLNRHSVNFVLFGHIAKGLLHARPLLDLKDPHDIELLKVLADELFDLVHSLGGAISGEHGDGRIRSAYLQQQYPDIYDVFVQTKNIFDPENILNPEILNADDPHQMQKHLRYGADYQRADTGRPLLSWPEGLADEIEKCHGCSKCTTVTAATRMCPIYKFTRAEAATPKAKANLLRALISGVVSERTLFEKAFQHVMECCVNCGSCHQECPSNVNIPKMALEARSRYVQKFGVSLESRLLSSVETAGRLTRNFAWLGDPLLQLQQPRKALQKLTGISAKRRLPQLARRSLFDRINPVEGTGSKAVLYFSGCYAGYIRPEIGEAALKVLKHLGMKVYIPDQHCCGLPMLSKGMVRQARNSVVRNLKRWSELVDRVAAIVVTCSSCGLALMQEWSYLLGKKRAASVADKLIHISRLINHRFDHLNLNALPETLSYHSPCHLKVQPDPTSSLQMLMRIPGSKVKNLDSHCCGMAGSWGLAAKNADLSLNIGQDLKQKLEQSGARIGITDCPTCRMQMEEISDLSIRHPVEVVARLL